MGENSKIGCGPTPVNGMDADGLALQNELAAVMAKHKAAGVHPGQAMLALIDVAAQTCILIEGNDDHPNIDPGMLFVRLLGHRICALRRAEAPQQPVHHQAGHA